ncbi:MAG: RNA-binding cell elongation regulator Jag/EloR [Dissulfuribacterales bacterium]
MANDFLEFEGKTVEYAIEAACRHFNISKEELKYEIITRGSTGLFGLGSKKAKIKVSQPVVKSVHKEIEKPEVSEGTVDIDREMGLQQPDESAKETPRGPRRSESTGRALRSERPRRSVPRVQPFDVMAEGPSKRTEREDTDVSSAVVSAKEETSEIRQPDEATLDEALNIARQIVTLSAFDCEVSVQKQNEQASLVFEGADIPLVIGRDGQTLESIEYIINRVLTHKMGSIVPVTLDAGTYRATRDEKLISFVRHKAEAVKKTGKSMALAPMNPRDRRLVHLSLRGMPGIRTSSVGDGERRKVVIIPLNRSRREARPVNPE